MDIFLIGFACGGISVCVIWWRDIERICRREDRLRRQRKVRQPQATLKDQLMANTLTRGRDA